MREEYSSTTAASSTSLNKAKYTEKESVDRIVDQDEDTPKMHRKTRSASMPANSISTATKSNCVFVANGIVFEEPSLVQSCHIDSEISPSHRNRSRNKCELDSSKIDITNSTLVSSSTSNTAISSARRQRSVSSAGDIISFKWLKNQSLRVPPSLPRQNAFLLKSSDYIALPDDEYFCESLEDD